MTTPLKILFCITLIVVVAIEVIVWRQGTPGVKIVALRYHVYAALEVAVFLVARFIWNRVNHLLSSSSWPVKVIITLVLGILLGLALINFLGMHLLGASYEPGLLILLSSYALGIMIFVFISFIFIDTGEFLMRKACFGRYARLSSERRNAVKKIRTLLSLCCGLLLTFYGLIGARNMQIEPVSIPIKGLEHRLNGTTIAQISDIHLGPFIGRSRMEKIVNVTNSLKPDIVVITGDLVDSPVVELAKAVEPLKDLKTKYGVYFCTGNHDYYTGDVDNWINYLPTVNVKPLINDRVCLLANDMKTCDGGFYIVGLEDIQTRRLQYGSHSMDLHRALSGRTKSVPTIVLAHQPHAAAEAIEWSDVHLVLSGHTHAGQVFPFMILVYLYNPFFVGLYQPYSGVYVYVSPGVNYYTLPYRHYRPGMTHITLVSA